MVHAAHLQFTQQIRVGSPDHFGQPRPLLDLIADKTGPWSHNLFTDIATPALAQVEQARVRLICIPLTVLTGNKENQDSDDIARAAQIHGIEAVPPEAAIRSAFKFAGPGEFPAPAGTPIFYFTPNWPTRQNLIFRSGGDDPPLLYPSASSRRGYRARTLWVFRCRR